MRIEYANGLRKEKGNSTIYVNPRISLLRAYLFSIFLDGSFFDEMAYSRGAYNVI